MGAQAAHAPAGMALLKNAVGDEMSGSLGFLNTAFCAAAVPGAALTGWVVAKWGWPILFMGKSVLYLAVLPVLFRWLPEKRFESQGQNEGTRWQDAWRHPSLQWICTMQYGCFPIGQLGCLLTVPEPVASRGLAIR